MRKDTNPITVGLLWHSLTSDNLGVGALTFGQMAIIAESARRRGHEVKFIIIGTRGGTPYPIDGYKVVGIAEFAWRAFKTGKFNAISMLRRCDIVFDIGEGDSFSDIYGNRRLTIQVAAKILARAFGNQLILSPQTIGPFKTRIGRILGTLGMSVATRVFARDHLSMQFLRDSGKAKQAREVIDVAFALPFERTPVPNDGRVRIGINVSGLLYSGGYSGKNEFQLTLDYRRLIERICEYYLARSSTDVFLVPHVISDASEVEDDWRASERLVKQFPKLKMGPRFVSPMEAKSFISTMDFFVGARMHACIAAFSSGVPVIPMAYSRKFNGLFGSLEYSHVLDCLKISTDQGFQMLTNALDKLDELEDEVKRGNRLAQAKIEAYTEGVSALLPT